MFARPTIAWVTVPDGVAILSALTATFSTLKGELDVRYAWVNSQVRRQSSN